METVKLVGGLDALNSRYKETAAEKGFDLEIMRKESRIKQTGPSDIVVFNTSVIGHKARSALNDSGAKLIYMNNHSISTFKKTIDALRQEIDAANKKAETN